MSHHPAASDGVLTFSVDLEPRSWPSHLTEAERDVARGLIRGRSCREIARERATSPSTVATQVSRLLEKSGCGSASELVGLLAAR